MSNNMIKVNYLSSILNIERTVADLRELQASSRNCLQRFQDIFKKHSILFILDKVITGLNRKKSLYLNQFMLFKKPIEYFIKILASVIGKIK